MATPFTNVAGDPNQAAKDNYNFYHSLLWIQVECAFGMFLVQRWGLLQMAMPQNFSVTKIAALIITSTKIHNFCRGESNIQESTPQEIFIETKFT